MMQKQADPPITSCAFGSGRFELTEKGVYHFGKDILGDKRPDGGNVLTSKVLAALPKHDGPKVIYGESSRLGHERLHLEGITFKQTPYDIKAR